MTINSDKKPKNASTQAIVGKAGKGGVIPPVERQFGKPNGNKRGNGFWKKEDTPRYKLEQMMKLSDEELESLAKDKSLPMFERKLANCVHNGTWREIKEMMNQVYGYPKQVVDNNNIDIVSILPKPAKKARKK